jgi:hypothetical protein
MTTHDPILSNTAISCQTHDVLYEVMNIQSDLSIMSATKPISVH